MKRDCPRRLSAKQAQQFVDRFNAAYPVGSPIVFRKDTETVVTTVKFPAEVRHNMPMGWFDKISGCYSLIGNDGGGIRYWRPEGAVVQ